MLAHLSYIFTNIIFIYGIVIACSYILLAVSSAIELRSYKRKNSYPENTVFFKAQVLPAVSLLAPAYNEGKNIVDNVRSLLTLHYPSYEVVIINDGSKDDTLKLLIEAYELEKIEYVYDNRLSTKPIRGIYKARNKAYRKLLVIDKENGGKADALNTGINICNNDLIACIDVDCILEHDSLLKLVKPFLETENKVIAAGGVIRVANSCEVVDGRLVKVHLPKSFLARVQVLEYFRAFLMGRMAWSKIDGLLLISGAFGMFDKEIAIRAGGYNPKTVGEDMELLVRMRRMMRDEKKEYSVGFIPDPLCWTEVPQDWKILKRQRNRWARGTAETLWMHRKMLFNPKYGIIGMLSMPFWFFFEWMAPLIEFGGLIIFVILMLLGNVNWVYFLSFSLLVFSFGIMFSLFSILFEELSFQQYKKPKEMLILVLTAILEPFIYHPVVTWCAVKGNIDLIRGKKNWGEMVRTGFTHAKK